MQLFMIVTGPFNSLLIALSPNLNSFFTLQLQVDWLIYNEIWPNPTSRASLSQANREFPKC